MNRIRPLRCFLLISVVSAFALIYLYAIPKVQAADIHINACGTLSTANSTYILDSDVSSLRTCFIISAANIILDLNGHKVIYNTNSYTPTSRTDPNIPKGISINTKATPVSPIVLKNGTVTQGDGATPYSAAINDTNGGGSNIEVSGITTSVKGHSSKGLYFNWITGGINIHDNTFISSITSIENRMAYDGYGVHLGGYDNAYEPSPITITNNHFVGGHGGIVAGGPNVTIYGNDIAHTSFGGNGFGILLSNALNNDVYQNNIHSANGCGILIDSNFTNVNVHNNTIDIKQHVNGDSGHGWGVKVRSYPTGPTWTFRGVTYPVGHAHIDNNNITVRADDLQAGGIGIYDSIPNMSNEYNNNTINAVTTTIQPAYDIILTGYATAADIGTVVKGNTLTSNSYNFAFNDSDGTGPNNVLFESNTIIKSALPAGGTYHTFKIGFGGSTSTGHILLDSRFQNGASFTDIKPNGNTNPPLTYNFYVKWFANLTVKETNGNPVSGATVTLLNKNNNQELTVTTDSQGKAKLALTDYLQTGSSQVGSTTLPTFTFHTPHTITVSKAGLGQATAQVIADATKDLEITVSPNISLNKQVDKTTAVSGETLTYSISYSNPTAFTYTNTRIEDAIPQGTTYVIGSASNGAIFNGSKLIWNIGNLAPSAYGTVTFQVRVN